MIKRHIENVNMTKCFVLGAGASFGYDESIPDIDRPPLGCEVISKGISLGILSKERYPSLFQLIEWYKEEKRAEMSGERIDIESVLEWAAMLHERHFDQLASSSPLEFDAAASKILIDYPVEKEKSIEENVVKYLNTPAVAKDIEAHPERADEYKKKRTEIAEISFRKQVAEYLDNRDRKYERLDLQEGLGESWYFTFELLRYYSILYKPKFDSYQRLALHHLQENYSVISLNYDVLFEMAVLNSNLLYAYPVWSEQPVPIFPFPPAGLSQYLVHAKRFLSRQSHPPTLSSVLRLPSF